MLRAFSYIITIFSSLGTPGQLVGNSGTEAGLFCREPVHDFGLIWAGNPEWLCAWFEVVNGGQISVWVRLHPSCSCLGTANFQIGPGATKPIPYCVNTKKVHENFERSASVQISNQPRYATCQRCGQALCVHPHDSNSASISCAGRWSTPLSIEYAVRSLYPGLPPAMTFIVSGLVYKNAVFKVLKGLNLS